jgi:hypothetical protein
MPPTEFEPAIPAGERLQTHALDRSAKYTTSILLKWSSVARKLGVLHRVLAVYCKCYTLTVVSFAVAGYWYIKM